MTARMGQKVCAMRLTTLLHITIETSPELGRGYRAIFYPRRRTPAVGIVQPRHWRNFGNRHTQNADLRMTHDTADWPREARPTVDGGPLRRWHGCCLKSVGPAWRPVASLSPVLLGAITSIGYKVRRQHGHSGACLKLVLVNTYMACGHNRHRIN